MPKSNEIELIVRLPTEEELVKKSISRVKDRMMKQAEAQIDEIIREEIRRGAVPDYGDAD